MNKNLDMNGSEIKVGDKIVYGKSSREHPIKKGVVINSNGKNIEVLGDGNKKTGFISHERILVLRLETISAVFVKSTKEILYSRSTHDMIWSKDGSVSIDGGREYTKITGDLENIVSVELNKSKLLDMILFYDYRFGNKNVPEMYLNGYYGKFQLDSTSNISFFEELVVNFEEIKDLTK